MTLSSQYPFNFRQGFTSIWAVLILLIQLNSPNPKCICGTDLSFHPNSILRSYKHTISFTPVPMWKQHWKCCHSLSDLMLMLQVESRYGQGWLCCCCCCTGSSVAFSSCGEWGLPSSCGAQASHCVGFSYRGAQALGARASVTGAHRLSSCGSRALEHRRKSCGAGVSCSIACRIFLRDWTHVPCIGRQILIHCAAREVPGMTF